LFGCSPIFPLLIQPLVVERYCRLQVLVLFCPLLEQYGLRKRRRRNEELMLASLLIILFSVVLCVYWFRYTCLLLLNMNQDEEFAWQVAAANRLKFVDAQNELKIQHERVALDRICSSLDNDYRMLSYLLEHASRKGARSVEQRLLAVDYRLMQVWYRLTRGASNTQSRRALEEMSNILNYLAAQMGRAARQAA